MTDTKEMSDLQKLLNEVTPGPWEIGSRITEKNGSAYERICGAGWISFARVWVRMDGKGSDSPEGLANARLIAMAPDLAAALIHEREAHAETQAALRAFIADLDKANAALILAKEALAKIILMDRLHGLTPDSGGRQVWHNGRNGAVAQTALDAIDKLGGE